MDLYIIEQSSVLYIKNGTDTAENFDIPSLSFFKRVITADNPGEGWEKFNEHKKQFDIVIVPMDRDIMIKIREADPQIPVVILYTPEKKGLLDEFIPFLSDGFIKTTFDKKQFNTVLGKALKPVFYKKEIKKKRYAPFPALEIQRAWGDDRKYSPSVETAPSLHRSNDDEA